MQKLMKKFVLLSLASIAVSLFAVQSTAAHVVVRPGEVLISERATFTVSVPNEHDTPVVGVRLLVPEGLKSVRPFAKAGWDISLTKAGEGEEAAVTEITWKSAEGNVPVDMKDEFLFGAMAPADATELKWKAYETYQDGTVVAWEQDPSEAEDNKPYSVTKVVAETTLQAQAKKTEQAAADADKSADRSLYVGIIALVLSIVSLAMVLKKKNSDNS